MDSPILTMVYHNNTIWTGCGDGCIYLLTKSGKITNVIQASSNMVYSSCAVGPFIWSSSNEDHIKVWVQPNSKDVHCIAIVPISSELHQMAQSSNGERIWISSENDDILEFSPTGKLLNRIETIHKHPIAAICFSQSPDRLWTADSSGLVSYHELKMGKKTMDRLRAKNCDSELDFTVESSNESEPYAVSNVSLGVVDNTDSLKKTDRSISNPMANMTWVSVRRHSSAGANSVRKIAFSPRVIVPIINDTNGEEEKKLETPEGE